MLKLFKEVCSVNLSLNESERRTVFYETIVLVSPFVLNLSYITLDATMAIFITYIS